MPEESVMRQGLTTWLRDECANAGNSMIYAILGADIAQTEALRLTIPNLPPDQTVYIAENVDNLIRSAVSSMTNLPIDLLTADERQEVFEVKREIEELLKAVRHPGVPGRPELMESLVGKLYGLNLVLRKMLLEKVVECQCGKPKSSRQETVGIIGSTFDVAKGRMDWLYTNQFASFLLYRDSIDEAVESKEAGRIPKTETLKPFTIDELRSLKEYGDKLYYKRE